MTKVLIADPSKAGLVMSTEVFKEKIPGVEISVAKTGKEFLRMLAQISPDMGIVDFDMPDVDGTTLIRYAKEIFDGPILLTAYPDDDIRNVINSELFAFEEAGPCIEKPVKYERMAEVIDRFLISKKRVLKRFTAKGKLELISPETKESKSSHRLQGTLVNISLGGACLRYSKATSYSSPGQSIMLSLQLPANRTKNGVVNTKIKGKLCWIDKKRKLIGIKFSHLTDPHRFALENLLRMNTEAA